VSTVGEALREDSRERQRRMSAEERLAEALALGLAAIETHAAANRVTEAEARRRLERATQAGRRRSEVMRKLAG
jgi:hypothetical protein